MTVEAAVETPSPEPTVGPPTDAPAQLPAATPTPPPEQGKLPIEPVDRPAPPRESIQLAMATKQRETLRTSKRKKAKGVVAVDADQQRQIELNLAIQTELTLEGPTDADVSELQKAMGDLEDFRDSLPDNEDIARGLTVKAV